MPSSCVASFALFLSTWLAAVATVAEVPKRHALLIAINDYKSSEFGDLRGALNDIELIRQVLTTRFGFSEENVRTVTDADATRVGILHALEDFVAQAGPEDQVYVHYSGHGSQVKDLNGDESDGLDETLVPHDGRTEGIADITDDELGAALSQLRTSDALIVLDSCHSGTATRGTGIRTRSIPQDTRIELYAHNEVGRRAVTALEDASYVLMTGAASNQSALDGPVDGQYYGFFSYCLGTSLAEAPEESSVNEVFSRIEQVLARLQERFGGISMPEPQLEAPESRIQSALFRAASAEASDSRGEARFPYLVVRSDRAKVILVGGAARGASTGTRWAIFSPNETTFLPGSAIATALVTATNKADAIAAISPSDAKVPHGARAVAATAPPPSDRIPVLLGAMPPPMAQSLRNLVTAGLPRVEFVEPDAFARFIVDFEQGQCQVYGLAGLHLVDSFAAKSAQVVADRLVPLFARSSSATILTSLHNPSSRLSLEVREALPDASIARGFQAVSSKAATAYRFRGEDEARAADNSLMLELRANMDCFITIVDVDQTGGINQLFPNALQNPTFYPHGLIPRDQQVRIPDSFDSGNQSGFFWDCSPPTGLETIQVFACTNIETAELYRRMIKELQGQATSRATERNTNNPFGTLREQLVSLWMPRGFQVVADAQAPSDNRSSDAPSPRDWTAAAITVLVEGR